MQRRILLLGIVLASVFTVGVAIATYMAGLAADENPGGDITVWPYLFIWCVGTAVIVVGTVSLGLVSARREAVRRKRALR